MLTTCSLPKHWLRRHERCVGALVTGMHEMSGPERHQYVVIRCHPFVHAPSLMVYRDTANQQPRRQRLPAQVYRPQCSRFIPSALDCDLERTDVARCLQAVSEEERAERLPMTVRVVDDGSRTMCLSTEFDHCTDERWILAFSSCECSATAAVRGAGTMLTAVSPTYLDALLHRLLIVLLRRLLLWQTILSMACAAIHDALRRYLLALEARRAASGLASGCSP